VKRAREGELMDNCSRAAAADLRIEGRRCNLNGFMVLLIPLTQPLPWASNFRSHLLVHMCACACVCCARTLTRTFLSWSIV